MKFEYAYSSSSRWVDTTGVNTAMPDRTAILKYARDNGWEMVTAMEGVLYFKRLIA